MVLKKINKFFTPTKIIVAPNDTFAKTLFTLSKEDWYNAFDTDKCPREIIESEKFKLTSKYSLRLLNDESSVKLAVDEHKNLFSPLNIFDRAVMTALVSEWIAGNVGVTVPAIWRLITGKPSGQNFKPTEKQATAIMKSVKKLACVHLQADLSDVCKKFNYHDDDGKPLFFEDYTPLIDCTISNGVFRGKDAQIISINSEPILYKIAKAKKQLKTFLSELLETGDSHNSDAVIAAKFYTAVRVLEIKGSPKLTKVISFDDVFKKCRISNASRYTLEIIRTAVFCTLINIKFSGELKKFDIVSEGNGKKNSKITLTYERKKT